MNSTADWNLRRIGLTQLPKVSGEPWYVNESDTFGVSVKKSQIYEKWLHEKWVWSWNYSWLITLDSFSPFACFHHATTTQLLFCQVIHRQCSHCLFIFVFVFTSNPTLSGFSPPQAVSAARFDVEPQFILLSHWSLPPTPPPRPCNMSRSIITWPTYLPPPAHCFSYSTPGSDQSDILPAPWKISIFYL